MSTPASPVTPVVAEELLAKRREAKQKKKEIQTVKKQKEIKSSKSTVKKTASLFSGKVTNKKILLPELVVCLVVLVFGTLVAPKDSKDDVHRMIIKGTALMAVFFVLAIVSTGGVGARKTANILGLLVTLSYLLNSSDIHNVVNWINDFFTKPKKKGQ